ncbi:protein SCO1 homolog, mitochondrial-like [Watersipora subatra]|uniref:protein SCO1 homolog, mitochondrial-like n=1 Tax=Watersipora subatra TaxID=2589382 RepID=UPI00355B29A6
MSYKLIRTLSHMRLIKTKPSLPFISFCNECFSNGHKMASSKRVSNYSTDRSSDLPPEDRDKTFKGSVISWKSVTAAAVFGIVGVLSLRELRKLKDAKLAESRGVVIGKADLGGDWTLMDHTGTKRKNTDFLGQWLILYFGFTFCPDVCPEQMEKLVEAVDRIDDDKTLPNVVPIFITLDPERDSPLLLAQYLSEFSEKVIGMTGTKEQIAQAAKAYRIYYSAGPKDEDNDYIVDHSIIMYLINPDGEFCEYFGQDKKASEIYQGSRKHMLAWKK